MGRESELSRRVNAAVRKFGYEWVLTALEDALDRLEDGEGPAANRGRPEPVVLAEQDPDEDDDPVVAARKRHQRRRAERLEKLRRDRRGRPAGGGSAGSSSASGDGGYVDRNPRTPGVVTGGED